MKFTAAVLPFVMLAGRVIAQSQQPLARLPPGCLLHAVNTQDEPGDLNSVCGNNAQDVQEAIANLCQENVASQAQAAFIATCGSAGMTVAAYTGSGTTAVTTDTEGHVVTKTAAAAGSSPTDNAASNLARNAGTGYVAVVVAVVAVAAL